MPSKLPQINVRLSAEEMVEMDRLAAELAGPHGVPHTKSDVVRAGMLALREKIEARKAEAEKPKGKQK